MATANPFSLPTIGADNPLAPEYLALERQKKIADLLMQKGQQLPEGQMVSGHYVAPSFTQQLNPLLNAYMGGNMAEQTEQKTAKLAQMLRGQNEAEVKNILEKTFGSSDYAPAVMPEIQRDDMGNVMPAIQQQIGKAPNKEAALLAGLTATSPIGQSIGQTLLAQKLKPAEQFNLGAEETRFRVKPDGSIEEIATGKGKIEKPPVSYQEFQLAKKEGFTGSYNDYQTLDANRKRPVTNVNVPVNVSTEKAYGQEFGLLIAKEDKDIRKAALEAPKLLQQSVQIKDLLNKGALTGTGADFALSAAKVFNLGGANNAEKIKNTELLVSNLGQNVLNNIKTSGLGAGQGFTNTDREFLEKVVGGQIKLDKTTLIQLANIQEKVAKSTVEQWNSRFKTMPKNVIEATGISPVNLPLSTNPNAIMNAADAIIGR